MVQISFVAPSSEELWVRTEIDQNANSLHYGFQPESEKSDSSNKGYILFDRACQGSSTAQISASYHLQNALL